MSPQIITQKADGPLDWPPPVDHEVRRWRTNRIQRLIKAADRMPLHLRSWFRVSEIADACARIPGSVDLDPAKRALTLELLRQAIHRGEFDDARKRSKVANLHPSPAAELRFARDSAAIADYFPELAEHLWIRRADCKAWFERNKIPFPMRWLPAVEAAAGQKPPAAEIVAELPGATKSNPLSKKSAKEFVERYCEDTEKAGRIPTQDGARKAALDAGHVGSRRRTDLAFKELKGHLKRGRPRKAKPEKDDAN
jgi:hypothetical protein